MGVLRIHVMVVLQSAQRICNALAIQAVQNIVEEFPIGIQYTVAEHSVVGCADDHGVFGDREKTFGFTA